jgi:hypothetical protein
MDNMIEEAARAICWASSEPVECRSDCMNAKRCCGKPPECCYRDAHAAATVIVERCAKVAESWVSEKQAWSTPAGSTGDYIAAAIRKLAGQ